MLIISGLFSGLHTASAYIASSTNYRLERDSINFSGTRSTSSNYLAEDTLGEVGTGRGTSTNYRVEAGYQQAEGTITISAPADVTLTPALTTLSGGLATGSAIWTVSTDNPAGYTLSIRAASSPALQSGSNFFANYTPASASTPDFTWSVVSTTSEFGFTPEGTDIASTYKDDGITCATGSSDTSTACWDSITTSNKITSRKTSSAPSGSSTTVKFRAEAGASSSQAAGDYQAIITVTAIAL